MIEADQPLLPVADGRRAVVIIDTPGVLVGKWWENDRTMGCFYP
jgi:hypothetical protein